MASAKNQEDLNMLDSRQLMSKVSGTRIWCGHSIRDQGPGMIGARVPLDTECT